jgi:hypothetical protein
MTDERTPEEELELDGEDQDSGHDADQLEDEDLDEDFDEEQEEEQEELDQKPRPSAALPQVRGRKPAEPAAPRTSVAHSDEELPYIDDRASKIWVGAIVAVFALILAYGLLFGKGGALTPPTPSPTPSPVPTATSTATAVPSASLTAAPSVTLTPAPSVTATPNASPTPAPSPS